MPAQRTKSDPTTPAGALPARAGWALSLALLGLACTPYGSELDEGLVEPGEELEDEAGELEPLYQALLPDDDLSTPTQLDPRDPRCQNEGTPREAWELDDPQADPRTGMLGVEREGKLLALPLQATRFDTVVVGTVAETEVVQVFTNPFDEAIEAVYLFPLHERAAVDDYWLTIGERSIRGKMQTREQARATYDAAKQAGRAAGLLEQQRPNIFTQKVANIPPGETIEVSMHVVQPLEQDHGTYSLVLPTVVGPRFMPGQAQGQAGPGPALDTDQVPDASKISAPMIPANAVTCGELQVSVTLDPGMRPRALRSKFHALDIRRDGDVAFAELDPAAGPVVANRDFVLSWDLGQKLPRAAIVAQPNADGEGGYFTLTVQPPEQVADADAIPRELVFVVDNSGSMGGKPIDTSKALMQRALAGLRPDDSFNVLRFSEQASGLSETMLAATDDNIARGQGYVSAMEGMGGTHMLSGIQAALALPHERERMRIVMFLTDGYIGNEHEIFELLERDIGDARLFSLGVGSSPNRYLLDGMARVGRGVVTYPDYEEDIELAVDTFYERIETPVLTDIELDWNGIGVAEVLPGEIPDLFAGQPLTVFGKYEGQPSGTLVVNAKARGTQVTLPVRFELAAAPDVRGVSSVWARHKIDELLAYPMRGPDSVDDATKQAVVELALAHRVMTEYTSFVAVDETHVVNPDGSVETVVQPLPVPEGTGVENYVGVGNMGLIGLGGGGGTGSGYGRGAGAGFGGRGKRVPKVRQAKSVVSGSLDSDVIRRIVRAHINEVRSCYTSTLEQDPNASGKVDIRFTIDAAGKVTSSSVHANHTQHAKLGECIARAVRKWSFPKPSGGGQVTVTYPFVLSPG